MLPSTRNELTLTILQRLRRRGAPTPAPTSTPNMALVGEEESDQLSDEDPTGRTEQAGGLTPSSLPKRKKKLVDEEDEAES